ncbi:unnamed protein product [Pieris macdunnoughi]|uniref:Reverse transcriptase domain-containing protein n=1 Tax=Pieris macdunnoughi TaxID=345717 RepID=A0A821YB60_9NEOP|nr:unnamed protein product [Pieris macdunnoughi]
MSVVCEHCLALKFKDESKGMCCLQGKVKLEEVLLPPEPLHSVLTDPDTQASTRCTSVAQPIDRDLIRSLQDMLHSHNCYIQSFKTAIESVPADNPDFNVVIHANKVPVGEHRGRYNAPSTSEVAVVIAGQQFDKRDIVLHSRDDNLQKNSELHRSYDSLQYPLMLCRGENGYAINISQVNPIGGTPLRKTVSWAVYEQMCLSRKVFKSRLKWAQNNQEQIKMDLIAEQRANKNFVQFWKSTGKLNLRPSIPASVGGESDPEKIANVFMKHFKVRSPLGPSVGAPFTGPDGCSESPGFFVSAKQIKDILNTMGRDKSPGHDGLNIEHLWYAGGHLPRVLSMLYSLCISHSYLSAALMDTIVVPVIKNRSGDISDKGNYRPISLATIMAKVLDSVLDSSLNNFMNLHDAQFGFRPGLSTEAAILSLKHTVQYYTKRNTPVYACFLDLTRAFDLVSYDVLWRKMEDRGVPTQLLNIFKFWYAKQNNTVKWSNAFSTSYRLESGVRQGGLSSPKLFNLNINDLSVELSSMCVGCRVNGVSISNLSYVDDMVLLAPTAGAITEMLRVCEVYAC